MEGIPSAKFSAASVTVQQMAAYVISDHYMGLQLCRYFSGHPVGNSQRYTMPFKISEISMLCLNGLPQNASHDLYPLYGVIHEEKCHKNCHGYHIWLTEWGYWCAPGYFPQKNKIWMITWLYINVFPTDG